MARLLIRWLARPYLLLTSVYELSQTLEELVSNPLDVERLTVLDDGLVPAHEPLGLDLQCVRVRMSPPEPTRRAELHVLRVDRWDVLQSPAKVSNQLNLLGRANVWRMNFAHFRTV